MILQVKFRPIVALTCAFVFAGAVYLWMPQLSPLGKDVRVWLEQRSRNFSELEIMHQSVVDTEYFYKAYIVTGEETFHEKFDRSVGKVNNQLSLLRSLNINETRNLDKLRRLQNGFRGAIDELKAEADLRPTQTQEKALEILSSTQQLNELEDISKDVALMQRSEYNLLREQLLIYNGLVRSGPYPWLALLVIFGVSGLVAFSGSATTGRKEEKDDSPLPSRSSEEYKLLIDELETTREQLERLTNLDRLTEVLNTRGLEKILSVEENRMVRAGGHLISILVNCDNFRNVNEELGHSTGDLVLKDVAKRITGTLRPSYHVARVGVDEFLVLLPDTQLAYGMRVAERIRMAASEASLHNAKNLKKLTVSVGVATLPASVSEVEQVISNSREAMKRSKDAGKDKVSLARETRSRDLSPEKISLVDKLTDADSYRVVFQPILDLSNEEVAGFEIFTRGLEGAFESPDEFFKLCIENNLLTPVDLQCLKLCIERSHTIAEGMRVHMNVFPSTIVDTSIEEFIDLFPITSGGHTYCIELSEQHFIIEPKHMRDSINAIREAGIMVAIDDIGFGRSSLESLILLEPDVVKVDRKYVTGVSDDVGKVRLLKRLTNVAKSLGAEVVAEGIERKDDVPVLQELGVHFGQGFLWGDLLEVLPTDPDGQRTLFQP